MTKRVLIIGGYGNFGGIIARGLASDANIQLLIAGRSADKAKKFIAGLKAAVPPEAVALDITENFPDVLKEVKPDIVIHTTGPFQMQGYGVVEACIRQGCHYIDLADARNFVTGIGVYDDVAKEKNLLAVSGASSVPALTAAILDHYRTRFATLENVDYGISAAQQTNRGLSTMSAVLSYVGEPFLTRDNGEEKRVFGWQDLHAVKYPEIGWRLFGNCDIPDLDLFPARYPGLQSIRFCAGTEIPFLHLGLWFISWLVRTGIMPPLEYAGPSLLKVSRLFDRLSKNRSGFHMLMYGTGKDGKPRGEAFYMIAKQGHGVNIPCMPAIYLAKGLASGAIIATGAKPCLDMIDLETYLSALKGLDIKILRDVPIALPKSPAKPKPKAAAKPGAKAGTTTPAKPGAKMPMNPKIKPTLPADAQAGATHTYKNDSAVPAFPDDKPLFIFDGDCVLCSRGAAWLMNKKGDAFRFASAQSPLGQALYKHYGLEANDTYLLIDGGNAYIKSDGYVHMLDILGSPWIYLRPLGEIPRDLRNKLYDLIARNRYKWFGQTEQCEMIPDEYKENMLK